MKRNFYLLICIAVFFCSCNKEVKIREMVVNDSLFKTIVVDPRDIKNPQKPANISEIAAGVEYIPLQTEDSILIGKAKKLIVWNGKYYIWDELTETVFCFDGKGHFLHKIQKQGQGPGEYPRIKGFTMDMKSGNICIYSDMAKAIYIYAENGDFIKKTSSALILSSFAVKNEFIYYYPGHMPNHDFFSKDYPGQYRYVVMKDGEYIHQQLKYIYDNKHSLIPQSGNNFSFYKDTILFIEYLKPEIYAIDSAGYLKPKYRIEFLTNTYSPSFDTKIDLEKINFEKENGRFATLWSGFYETDNYLFFNYAWGIIGGVYINKKDNSIHNMGFFLTDDFNHNTMPVTTDFVDEKNMYKIEEPASLLRKKTKSEFSPYLENIVSEIQEFDNPVIIKIKLKDEN